MTGEYLDYAGSYRMQSCRAGEAAVLKGTFITPDDSLTLSQINDYLSRQPDWNGSSKASLRVVDVCERGGPFARYDDALYYASNFSAGAQDFDLLDIGKLAALTERRLPKLRAILSPETLAVAADSLVGAVDEYMCHEAGHRRGYSIEEKVADGFFRCRGRLSWPLIYMEEFRADMLSWRAAMALLTRSSAARVICFTLTHRLGLAIENLREGRPGAGFIPFLHFAGMTDHGLIEVRRRSHALELSFGEHEDAVLGAAMRALDQFEDAMHIGGEGGRPDQEAEAMLAYAVGWHAREELVSIFRELMLGRH